MAHIGTAIPCACRGADFGLFYHVIAIVPLIEQELAVAELSLSYAQNSSYAAQIGASINLPPAFFSPEQRHWVFLPANAELVPEGASVATHQYVCAIYWALIAMTNLKGLPAHENRQCLVLSTEVLYPIAERVLTMGAFIFGAMVYASIYGNISSFLQTLDGSGLRYRKRMAEMSEFFNYHNVPAVLQKRYVYTTTVVHRCILSPPSNLRVYAHSVRNYVEFHFSVTKGIDVEGFNNDLPSHLQLELFLHLNRRMVEQVPLFENMPSTFIKSIVMKLRPAVCIAGDHLFCAGDPMDAMCARPSSPNPRGVAWSCVHASVLERDL